MTKTEFIKQFEEVLEVESGTIQEDHLLSDIASWDSLTVMSFIAMVDDNFGVTMQPEQIKAAKRVSDFIQILHDHIHE